MKGVLWLVFYYILLSEFVGQYTEYMVMHGTSNIKYQDLFNKLDFFRGFSTTTPF
jgi:hypothetical protein